LIAFLILNPSKRLSAISRKYSFTNSPSVKGLHFLTITLLNLKVDMTLDLPSTVVEQLISSGSGFPSNATLV
jgi:hypothetical protein